MWRIDLGVTRCEAVTGREGGGTQLRLTMLQTDGNFCYDSKLYRNLRPAQVLHTHLGFPDELKSQVHA